MRKKLASFVVNCRYVILIVMTILAIVSAFLMQKVEINEDMTKYLPDDSAMKHGMDIMTENFPEMETSQTIRVMFDDLTADEKETVLEALQNIEYVDSVSYDADSADYNVDNHTLFVINSEYEYDSKEMVSIENTLNSDFSEYSMVWNNDDTGIPHIPTWILLSAVGILMVILFVMCGSWIEPVLFLLGIGFAVLLNMGTNFFLGSVSGITSSISSILQLILSMDYSIILINRYKQEKEHFSDNKDAMKAAVENAFSSIVSSGMTTVIGLVMLVFMSFKIGMDLGVVLAKGVFISMICVLVLMPGVFILCDKLIQKTAKKDLHIPMNWAGNFSHKMRYVISGVFVVLMVSAYILQQQTGIVYTLEKEDKVAEVFQADNTLVVVYENNDEGSVSDVTEWLNNDENVKSVMSYHTMLATPYTSEKLSEEISNLSDDMQLDKNVLAMFYYDYYTGDEPIEMTASEFLTFISETVVNDELFSEYIDEDMSGSVDKIGKFADAAQLTKPMNSAEMAEFFEMEESKVNQLFSVYFGTQKMEQGISYAEFMNFLVTDIMNDPTYGAAFDEAVKAQLQQSNALVQAGASGEAYSVSEMNTVLSGMGLDFGEQMVMLTYSYHYGAEFTGSEILTLPEFLNTLITKVVQDPNYGAYFDQQTATKLQTLYGVVALGADSTTYHYSDMAAMLSMDAEQMAQLYMLYWGNNSADNEMSVKDFIDYISTTILSNEAYAGQFDEETSAMLTTAQKLVNVVVSEEKYTAKQMYELISGISTDIDENSLELMYLYAAAVNHSNQDWTMTTEELLNYLVDAVLTDERFSGLLDEDAKAALTDAQVTLDDGKKQLLSEQYSRMIITTGYPAESEETFSFIGGLSSLCDEKLTGDFYFVGNSAMNYEMSQTFDEELLFITILTAVVIYLIVAISSKSLTIPLILVLLVQTGVYITVSTIGLQGNTIYYLALLIVQCILMGATIDYGILYTNYYVENRKNNNVLESLKKAYEGAVHTIATSGLILVIVTAIVGNGFKEPTVAAIVKTLSIGSFTAIVLILFILPGVLACCDKLIIKKNKKA